MKNRNKDRLPVAACAKYSMKIISVKTSYIYLVRVVELLQAGGKYGQRS